MGLTSLCISSIMHDHQIIEERDPFLLWYLRNPSLMQNSWQLFAASPDSRFPGLGSCSYPRSGLAASQLPLPVERLYPVKSPLLMQVRLQRSIAERCQAMQKRPDFV